MAITIARLKLELYEYNYVMSWWWGQIKAFIQISMSYSKRKAASRRRSSLQVTYKLQTVALRLGTYCSLGYTLPQSSSWEILFGSLWPSPDDWMYSQACVQEIKCGKRRFCQTLIVCWSCLRRIHSVRLRPSEVNQLLCWRLFLVCQFDCGIWDKESTQRTIRLYIHSFRCQLQSWVDQLEISYWTLKVFY